MNISFSNLFKTLFKTLLSVFKVIEPILFIVIILIILFLIKFVIYIFYFRILKHIKPIKLENKVNYKEPGFLKKIFILFPRQLAYDTLTKDPNDFGEFGIHIIIGEQGSGKSMTAIYLMEKWKRRYPNVKIFTNMGYKYEDAELSHWKQLITNNNGKMGVINVIDDLKAWWSNKDSKDLPPEVLSEICQQRKQRKAIIGTIQVFSEAPKPLRSQTHYIYVPITIFGCLTIVRMTKKQYYDSENDRFKRFCGFFVFVHNQHLRSSYDTYKKIEKYKDTEFATPEFFKST